MADIPDGNEATIQQLIKGRKPFACITYWQTQAAKANAEQERMSECRLVTELRRREWQGWNADHVWDLLSCHDLRVGDIGDLQSLGEDYAEAIGLEPDEVAVYTDVPLKSFSDGWDSPPLPLWLTGLILGYSVENTISLYLE